MKIAILGSTGGTGIELINQGLALNYKIVAMARNPENLTVIDPHPNLEIKQGNIFNIESISNVISGCDVVISSIGISSIFKARKPNGVYSKGTANLIEAMKATGVNQLIAISSSGVEPSPTDPFIFKKIIKPIFLDKMYEDMLVMESSLKASQLDWTIVRPPYLTNGPQTASYRISIDENFKDDKDLSRADLAHFIINKTISKQYSKKVIAISY
jgi:putative NADH-flavin reductase